MDNELLCDFSRSIELRDGHPFRRWLGCVHRLESRAFPGDPPTLADCEQPFERRATVRSGDESFKLAHRLEDRGGVGLFGPAQRVDRSSKSIKKRLQLIVSAERPKQGI